MSAQAAELRGVDAEVQKVFLGLVQRDDETPQEICDTCHTWFGSKTSAMYRFYKGEAVKPMTLAREASQALGENALGATEDKRLVDLRIWASRRGAMCSAAKDLREANDAFLEAVKALNLDPYIAERVRKAACWDGK